MLITSPSHKPVFLKLPPETAGPQSPATKQIKPLKLHRHWESKHAPLKDKLEDFYKRKRDELANKTKVAKNDLTENEKVAKTSYYFKPHFKIQ